jgi:hypothetical protein
MTPHLPVTGGHQFPCRCLPRHTLRSEGDSTPVDAVMAKSRFSDATEPFSLSAAPPCARSTGGAVERLVAASATTA